MLAPDTRTPIDLLLQKWAEAIQGGICQHPLHVDPDTQQADFKFDTDYWWRNTWTSKGKVDYVLQLLPGRTASEAIDEMVRRRGKWNFDCATFVQCVYLRTLLNRLGSKAFDKRLTEQSKETLGAILFRSHLSTGLAIPAERIKEFPAVRRGEVPATFFAERGARVKTAPVGGEVVFTNMDAREGSQFRNENTIKLELDSFIAHAINPTSAVVTFDEIEKELTRIAAEDDPRLTDQTQVICITWVADYSLR